MANNPQSKENNKKSTPLEIIAMSLTVIFYLFAIADGVWFLVQLANGGIK